MNDNIKEISIEGLEILGKGRTAVVYKLDDNKVLKLYTEGFPIAKLEKEFLLAKIAIDAGIPTAQTYEIVKCENSYGNVFELIDSDTLSHVLENDPENYADNMKKYGAFIKNIHSIEINDKNAKSFLDTITMAIQMSSFLTDTEKAKTLDIIKQIPDRKTFVHGDIKPGNLMYCNGDLKIIDMASSGVGHPIFDIAAMYRSKVFIPEVIEYKGEEKINDGKKMFKDFVSAYFNTTDNEMIDKVEHQSRLISCMFLSCAGNEYYEPAVRAMDKIKENLFAEIDAGIKIDF